MEYVKFAAFALFVLGGVWWLGRAMTRTGRNKGATHGGGFDGMVDGADDFH